MATCNTMYLMSESEAKSYTFRLKPELMERVRLHADEMAKQVPGVEFSQTDALNALLTRALGDTPEGPIIEAVYFPQTDPASMGRYGLYINLAVVSEITVVETGPRPPGSAKMRWEDRDRLRLLIDGQPITYAFRDNEAFIRKWKEWWKYQTDRLIGWRRE